VSPSGKLIGALFAVGSTGFLLGPAPGFVDLVGQGADGAVFFAGSIFFTSAAFLQYLGAAHDNPPRSRPPGLFAFDPRALDAWAALIQLAGTLFFNISTFEALSSGLDAMEANRLVWAPDVFGSICFLVSGCLAFAVVRHQHRSDPERTPEEAMATVNLAGCVLFGVSAAASYIVPNTGSILDLAAANWTTSLGALCFLVGAVMLVRISSAEEDRSVPA
jgi:hypothetical protein